MAIYFPSNQSIKKLDESKIKYSICCQGDTESIVLVKEKYINELHKVLLFQIKGKNAQLKESKIKAKKSKSKSKNKN